jgi:hypothetical protein
MYHVSPDMRSSLLPVKSFPITHREEAERWAFRQANTHRRTYILWQLDQGIPTRLATYTPTPIPF